MTIQKRKATSQPIKSDRIEEEKAYLEAETVPEVVATEEESTAPEALEPTGKIFLGDEDKRLLKKFNKHIVNKLGLGGNRSFKV